MGSTTQALGPTPPCTASERAELLTASTEKFILRCSLTLAPHEKIRRPVQLDGESDGVILDCADQTRERNTDGTLKVIPISFFTQVGDLVPPAISMKSNLDFPSKTEEGLYQRDRLENVIVRNCTIEGAIRVYADGMPTGSSSDTVQSSHDFEWPTSGWTVAPHVMRVRDAAPRDIVLDNVNLIAKGATPLYLGPGVTRFTLKNSTVRGSGTGNGPGIYLDAESWQNQIINNTINVKTSGREQIAVDASSHNFIAGNQIANLNKGGIHLYRNCGEKGGIRYTPPSYNVITSNRFYYDEYKHSFFNKRDYVAVILSSRNGDPKQSRDYCDDDQWAADQLPPGFESGRNTYYDNAQYNIVTDNQLRNRSPSHYIVDNSFDNSNVRTNNRRVGKLVDEPTPCSWPTGQLYMLPHGETERFVTDILNQRICMRVTCNDGALESETCDPPASEPIPFSCQVTDNNSGCSMARWCPSGKHISSVTAACNLELGAVTDGEFEGLPFGFMTVVTPSEVPSDGSCTVLGQTIRTDNTILTFPEDEAFFTASCKERDSTGGDCHIRGEFTCD